MMQALVMFDVVSFLDGSSPSYPNFSWKSTGFLHFLLPLSYTTVQPLSRYDVFRRFINNAIGSGALSPAEVFRSLIPPRVL